MSNYKLAIALLKEMSGQSKVMTIPRLYIEYMGSLDGGLVLSQVIYYSDRGSRTDGWFYKSYVEWTEELTLTKYQVSKQANIMKDKSILETKVMKANGSPTVHYRFLFDAFQLSLVKFFNYRKSSFLTIDSQETSLSITESTTESTHRVSPKINFGEAAQKDSFDDHFGPNPRQAEIDKHKNTPKMAPAELMLASLGAGQAVPRELIRLREEGWQIKESDLELAISVFARVTGSVLPTIANQRKLWMVGCREHLEEAAFEGHLEKLYQKVWDQVQGKVKIGKLTMSHPRAFTRMMYQIINLETSTNKTKITTAILLQRMQTDGVIRLAKGGDKAHYVWIESGEPVQNVPREIIRKYL